TRPAATTRPTGATRPADAANPADAAASPTQGWTQRGCVAVLKDGALVVTGQGPTPFLGMTVGTKGPGEVIVRARCAAGGDGKVEWLPPGKTPAAATAAGEVRSALFKLAPGADWQDVTVRLPDDAAVGILRVYLPAQHQPVELRAIEVKAAGKSKRWEFK
ncbi:MAG TPA: hypothetical protein VF796_23815, partial [Humisphaera sp.]